MTRKFTELERKMSPASIARSDAIYQQQHQEMKERDIFSELMEGLDALEIMRKEAANKISLRQPDENSP